MLNRAFVFGLCWNCDCLCLYSNYFSGSFLWCLLDKWVLLCFFNCFFLLAFCARTDLPSLLSGALCSHSLICASISASVALGKAYHWRIYIIIITCSLARLNWLIRHKLWDQNVSNLHFIWWNSQHVVDQFATEWYTRRLSSVCSDFHVSQKMCYLNTNRITITRKVHNCGCSNCIDTSVWWSFIYRPRATLCITKTFLYIFIVIIVCLSALLNRIKTHKLRDRNVSDLRFVWQSWWHVVDQFVT